MLYYGYCGMKGAVLTMIGVRERFLMIEIRKSDMLDI